MLNSISHRTAFVVLFALVLGSTPAPAEDEAIPTLPVATPVPAVNPAPSKAVGKSAEKSLPPPVSSTVSITKVVGEVGEQFVTSREVKINSAIEQATDVKPASGDEGAKILTGTERAFPGEVSRVLDEWAVIFEARALGSTNVSKADVAKMIAQVQERWGTKSSWKDLEVGVDELHLMVEHKLMALDFQKLKSDPALSPVSDEEALSYYKKNRLRFGSLPFSSFSDNIKAYLVKSQVERRLSEWHEVLRRKYKTRNFISG